VDVVLRDFRVRVILDRLEFRRKIRGGLIPRPEMIMERPTAIASPMAMPIKTWKAVLI
jgi:hypothetical protein